MRRIEEGLLHVGVMVVVRASGHEHWHRYGHVYAAESVSARVNVAQVVMGSHEVVLERRRRVVGQQRAAVVWLKFI